MIELVVLLVVAVIGSACFAPFEVETPAWREIVKWGVAIGLTLGLKSLVRHWALLLPVLGGIAEATGHYLWCRRHQIDPLRATPRRRYYDLRGWDWND